MSIYNWKLITNLGDSSLLLPYAALFVLWLLLAPPTRRASIAWLATVFTGGLLVATTKVIYMGWRLGIPALNFIGLSGHTTLSFIIWPVLLALLVGRNNMSQVCGLAAGIAIAITIGISRLIIHVHSLSEVLLGAITGGMLTSAFLLPRRASLRLRVPRLWLLASMILPLMTGYGKPMPSGHILAEVARKLSGHANIYTRADLYTPRHLQSFAGFRAVPPQLPAAQPGQFHSGCPKEAGDADIIIFVATRS